MELKKRDKVFIAIWFATWIFAAALGLCGCSVGGDEPMALMEKVRQSNIGGSGVPIPAAGVASTGDRGIGERTGIMRMPGSEADQQDPRMLAIAIQAVAGKTTATGLQPFGGGPLTAILQWGTGDGALQEAEFDLPLNGTGVPVFGGQQAPSQSGVVVSAPASSILVAARNWANWIPPIGVALSGLIAPPVVSASAAVGTRSTTSKLWLTRWAVHQGAGLPNGNNVTIAVPAFAKSFRILRNSAANGISIVVGGQTVNLDGPYTVAANVPAPQIDLSGSSSTVDITNTGPGGINELAVLFEIGL